MTAPLSTGHRVDGPLARFGDRLQTLIAAAELTQSEFAARVPCSTSFLSSMLRGEKVPGAEMLYAMKVEFGISTDWLLAGEGSMLTGGELDVDRYRFHAALLELARRKEVDGDADATSLVAALLDGSEQVEQLSDGALHLLEQCQGATHAQVFDAVFYSTHARISNNQEWAAATLRGACTEHQLRRPLRLAPAPTTVERLNQGRRSVPSTAPDLLRESSDSKVDGRVVQKVTGRHATVTGTGKVKIENHFGLKRERKHD